MTRGLPVEAEEGVPPGPAAVPQLAGPQGRLTSQSVTLPWSLLCVPVDVSLMEEAS